MIETDISFALAFLAGVVSFLSPCVLPILPSFLGYLSGVSLSKASLEHPSWVLRRHVAWHALLFCVGFLAVFLSVGASIGWMGQLFVLHQRTLQTVGGVLIFFLALWSFGLFRHSFFQKEYRFKMPRRFDDLGGGLRSVGVGILFSFGWAPCYGPITGAILTLIAVQGQGWQGAWLFGAYSLGFVVPFLTFALALGHATQWIQKSRIWLKAFRWISGVLLLGLSVLLLSGEFSSVVFFLSGGWSGL